MDLVEEGMLPGLRAVAEAGGARSVAPPQKAPVPFSNTRLRAYSSRVNALMQEQVGREERQKESRGTKLAQRADGGGGRGGYMEARQSGEPGPAEPASQEGRGTGRYDHALDTIALLERQMAQVQDSMRSLEGGPAAKSGASSQRGRKPAGRVRATKSLKGGGTMPVSRGGAFILGQALDHMDAGPTQPPELGENEDFNGARFQSDFERLDMVFLEGIEQVSALCSEQGGLMLKVRERLSGLFENMSTIAVQAHSASSRAKLELAAAQAALGQETADLERVRGEVRALKDEQNTLRQQAGALAAEYGEHRKTSAEEIEELKMQNNLLSAKVEHYRNQAESMHTMCNEVVESNVKSLKEERELLRSDRDGLSQQLRFLEVQIAKAQVETARHIAVDHIATQTEPMKLEDFEGIGKEDAPDRDNQPSSPTAQQIQTPRRGSFLGTTSLKANRRVQLGHFVNILSLSAIGRVKGLSWTLHSIAQVYHDKIRLDSQGDREGRPRASLANFVYDWYLTRYGLREKAEAVLLDLLSSVRYHAGANLKVQHFAQFCGLTLSKNCGMEELNFFLYCLQCMTGGVEIGVLFPTDAGGDSTYWMAHDKVVDITKKVFHSIGHGDIVHEIVTRLEAMQDPSKQMHDTDRVLDAFLDEWQRQYGKAAAHITAIFQTTLPNSSEALSFDEFVRVAKAIEGGKREHRNFSLLYREALHASAHPNRVSQETFLAAARAHGLGKWSIDFPSLPKLEAVTVAYVDDKESDPNCLLSSERLFILLDMEIESDDLDLKMTRLKMKLGEGPMFDRIEKRLNAFHGKYGERSDADGAWSTYRSFLGEVESTLFRHRLGIREVDVHMRVGTSLFGRGGAPSQTPLMISLAQNLPPGDTAHAAESALDMLQAAEDTRGRKR